MIDKLDSKIELVCDGCGCCSGKPYDNEDFSIMIADAKSNGWKIRKGPDTRWRWGHRCPEC